MSITWRNGMHAIFFAVQSEVNFMRLMSISSGSINANEWNDDSKYLFQHYRKYPPALYTGAWRASTPFGYLTRLLAKVE